MGGMGDTFSHTTNKTNTSITRLGCAESAASLAIYKAVEEKHAKITQTAIKILGAILVGQFSTTGLVPVAYAIIGTPTPDQWHLPVPVQ